MGKTAEKITIDGNPALEENKMEGPPDSENVPMSEENINGIQKNVFIGRTEQV